MTAAVKKFPIHPSHPERICWGCDKYCPADSMMCGNGSVVTPHPSELFGEDWMTWGLDTEIPEILKNTDSAMRFGTSCIQAAAESPAAEQRAQRRNESDPPSPPAPSSEAGEGMPPARQLLHRHVQSSRNGTKVDLEVTLNSAQQGSHIVMRIHRSPHNLHTQTVEYVTDDSTLDAAICTGFEIAQAVIDGRPC